jgi:uncharacterized protein (TIGR02271 family)
MHKPGESKELIVELATEELVPEKRVREVGQVRITKVVRTEVKHFTVAVRREELLVERVAVESAQAREGGERLGTLKPFEQGTLVIPLYEEQVEVLTRPYVWQEVRVSKRLEEEEREVRATVRREEARVEEAGEVVLDGPVDGFHA